MIACQAGDDGFLFPRQVYCFWSSARLDLLPCHHVTQNGWQRLKLALELTIGGIGQLNICPKKKSGMIDPPLRQRTDTPV